MNKKIEQALFGEKINLQYREENEKSIHILAVFGVTMRHLHVELVLHLVQIVRVGLEHGGLLLEQLTPLLLKVGVGGFLERQRRAEAELSRRSESFGRLLEGERNLGNKGGKLRINLNF